MLVDTQKLQRKLTVVLFIDFSKACDHINRNMLWYKLDKISIGDCAVFTCPVDRYLGVAFDQELSMETLVKNIWHTYAASVVSEPV